MCGSTGAQNQIQSSQIAFMNQAAAQASAIFGQDSTVFNDLLATFAPTVAAGPNQQGFSAQEESNLNSQAITETGQAYKNAKQALGENQSASGGGNVALPGGASIGENLGLAESAANQTSSELSQITEANYATGRQNYDFAVQGLMAAPGVFGSSTNATNALTGSRSSAANTANQIAQQNNSWVSAVTGALGNVAGVAVKGAFGGFDSGSGLMDT